MPSSPRAIARAGERELRERVRAGYRAPSLARLAALVVLFLAGVQASLMIYRAMIPDAKGAFMALMHMNLAIYLAFFFVSFFIFFFVGIFGVAMLQLSGLVDLAAEGADQQIPGRSCARRGTRAVRRYRALPRIGASAVCCR